MTPLETEANPNIRVGPLRWGRPKLHYYFNSKIGISAVQLLIQSYAFTIPRCQQVNSTASCFVAPRLRLR